LVFGENNVLKNRELLTAPEIATADVGDNVGENACNVGEKLDIESSIRAKFGETAPVNDIPNIVSRPFTGGERVRFEGAKR
jgi:hypothetical protein